ncbi:Helicase loader DnaB [Streptococcus infantarius subsp. infantarius]|nr:Helicase loader DnaB [Streptococcus infantarius subsp. infantarius]
MTRLLEYIGLDGMDMELVKEAVKRTTDSGIDNPNYTFKILDSWKAKGITTVEQANEEKENFQSQKQRRSYPNQQQPSKSNVPEWVDEEYKHEATVDEQAQLEALKKSMLED